MKYPLSLALFDYVPVALNLIGQLLLITVLQFDPGYLQFMAVVGVALMTLGGGLKATWKTIISASQRDYRWMEHALFLGLTPGACLLAWAVWNAQRVMGGELAITLWPVCLLTIAVFLAWSAKKTGGGSGKWFMPLVLLLTLSMAVISVNAFLIAKHQGVLVAAGLFILSFGISLVTSMVSRKVATIKLQWLMESANSLSALFFLGAVLLLL
jgi:hypothetical protein